MFIKSLALHRELDYVFYFCGNLEMGAKMLFFTTGETRAEKDEILTKLEIWKVVGAERGPFHIC